VFYYISVMNENYRSRRCRPGAEAGIIKGGYLLRSGGKGKVRATLLGSGTILRECIAAAELLEQQFGVPADVFSITSFSELRREALECERWNLLHPAESRACRTCRRCSRARRPAGRGDRLRAQRTGSDPPVGAAAVRHARYRRLRAQ
jgi:pyruvate dehydrogenase complex dehydrogenase (E1) component